MRANRLGGLRLALCAIGLGAPASAQVATALLVEDGPIPGAPGQTVSFLNNTAVNHVGGFAINVGADDGSGGSISHIWGNAAGGPGMVIRSEGTFGNFQQTSFESFYGISDSGQVAYSPFCNDLTTGATSLDSVWLDDAVVAIEGQPAQGMPGQFWSFGSRPGVTAAGTPYWVGGITANQGGSTQNRGLFFDTSAQVLLLGGQMVPNLPLPLDDGTTVSFDYRFSADGMRYIAEVQLEGASSLADNAIVISGAGLLLDGVLVLEGNGVPATVGGEPGEEWDNFDFTGITDGGSWFFSGDTAGGSSNDEIVVRDGQIVLREGDMLDGQVLGSSIEGGYLNEDGDLALIWDVGADEALIINDSVVLVEGDMVDLDGDGMLDPGTSLVNFTGISALTLSDRDSMGRVNAYFTADIDVNGTSTTLDDVEGFFCFAFQAGPPQTDVFVDIKPGGCPNPLNTISNGVLPVAVLGTMDFDVNDIDVASVRLSRADGVGGMVAPLEGPPGPHTVVEDAGTPFFGEPCDCHDLEGDGIDDLSMKFRTEELVETLQLDAVPTGVSIELVVSGALDDGGLFSGSDCVSIISPTPGNMQFSSALADTFFDVSPIDVNTDGGGFGTFERAFVPGTSITISAPVFTQEMRLVGWRVDGTFVQTMAPLHMPVLAPVAVEPVYIPMSIRSRHTASTH